MEALVVAIAIAFVSVLLTSYAAIKLIVEKKPVYFTVPVPSEAKPGWRGTKTLDKLSVSDPTDPHKIVCFDPATAKYLGTVRANTTADVVTALANARAAQQKWKLTSFAERRRVLESLLKFIVANQDDICRVSCRDTGKTMVDAKLGEVLTTCNVISWIAIHGERALAPDYRPNGGLLPHKIAKIEYEPLGVVAALISWNYPFHNMVGQIAPALFVGNGILVKASEQAAWSLHYYSKIIHACLTECGHDPNIVQFLTGFADCGEAIVKSSVDSVTFVGSPEVGKLVAKAASENLTPCVMELGGKDCAIVCHDADLSQVIPMVMRATFQHAGQNCAGIERVLVHESLYAKFVDEIAERIRKLRVGAPLDEDFDVDVGALTMGGNAADLRNYINNAVSQGANLILGGNPYIHPRFPSAYFFEPTLLIDVTTEMDIAQKELFAPVLLVMKFCTEEEAVNICNSTQYGLSNSVFTKDQRRGEWMARQLRSGMTNVNDIAATYLCQLPFGGTKHSGYGRFAGKEGLHAQCLAKSMTIDRVPSIFKTSVPTVFDYPMDNNSAAYVRSLIEFNFGDSLLKKLKGLAELVIRSFS